MTLYDEKFYWAMTAEYANWTPWTKLRMAQVIKMVQPCPGDKILDLGCATGSVVHFCSKFGAEVIGVDFSELAIQKAEKLHGGSKNTRFLVRDVANLYGLDNSYFDKAVALDLVEHLYNDVFQRMFGDVFVDLLNIRCATTDYYHGDVQLPPVPGFYYLKQVFPWFNGPNI